MRNISLVVASMILATSSVLLNAANENLNVIVKNESGNELVSNLTTSSLEVKAKNLLESNKSEILNIAFALKIDKNPLEILESWGSASVDENGNSNYEENGKSNQAEVKIKADELLRDKINIFAKRNDLENSQSVKKALLIPSSNVEVAINRENLLAFVNKNHDLIDGFDIATTATNLSQDISSKDEVLDKVIKTIDGKTYTFIKAQTDDGKGFIVAKDENGNFTDANIKAKDNFASDIKQILSSKDEYVKIAVAIKADEQIPEVIQSSGSVLVDEMGDFHYTYNGMIVDKTAFEYLSKKDHAKAKEIKNSIRTNPNLEKFIEKNSLESEFAKKAINENLSYVELSIKKDEVKEFVEKNKDLIDGLNLASEPTSTLDSAMLSTKINPYALNYSGRRGAGIGIYISEAYGCPNPGYISNYTRLSGVQDSHGQLVTAILRGVSPESYIYCRGDETFPLGNDLNGYSPNPRVYIQSHSWSFGILSHNENYMVQDRAWDTHAYNSDTAIFMAAGNIDKRETGHLESPAKALNLITVGNYDDSTDTISASSCFKDSQIGNNKPEIVAPGMNIGVMGIYLTDAGTSSAAPHAAAFAADLMSQYSWLKQQPAYMKAYMLASATKQISGGTDKVGVGGIDFYNATYNGSNWWFNGDNNSFDSYATNNYITRYVNLKAGEKTRVAIAWFNRGEYVYANRTAFRSLSMDLDLRVYDPNGNYIGASVSSNNPYEIVDFTPSVSGQYAIKINRYSNNDTNCALKLGLSVQW